MTADDDGAADTSVSAATSSPGAAGGAGKPWSATAAEVITATLGGDVDMVPLLFALRLRKARGDVAVGRHAEARRAIAQMHAWFGTDTEAGAAAAAAAAAASEGLGSGADAGGADRSASPFLSSSPSLSKTPSLLALPVVTAWPGAAPSPALPPPASLMGDFTAASASSSAFSSSSGFGAGVGGLLVSGSEGAGGAGRAGPWAGEGLSLRRADYLLELYALELALAEADDDERARRRLVRRTHGMQLVSAEPRTQAVVRLAWGEVAGDDSAWGAAYMHLFQAFTLVRDWEDKALAGRCLLSAVVANLVLGADTNPLQVGRRQCVWHDVEWEWGSIVACYCFSLD